MPVSVEFIRKLEKTPPELRQVLLDLLDEVERQREASVTKKEFLEFAKQTEENFQRVWKAINELAEAQKRAEERLTRLEETVEKLAEAQKRTEERLTRLEETVEKLAEAQKRTEEELKKLTGEHRKTREQLGGLTHTVGYILEDRAYMGLPPLLERDFDIKLKESLRRDWIEVGPGRFVEVNIIGKAERNGKNVWILGECKTQLKKRDVDRFLNHLKNIEAYLTGEKLPVIVTYQTSPPVREYAEKEGIHIYFSYQMPL